MVAFHNLLPPIYYFKCLAFPNRHLPYPPANSSSGAQRNFLVMLYKPFNVKANHIVSGHNHEVMT